MVRSGGELIKVPFIKEECDEAEHWFLETIDKIYEDVHFQSRPNQIRKQIKELKEAYDRKDIKFDVYLKQKKKLETELKKTSFYCWQLCGVREICPDKDKGPKEG